MKKQNEQEREAHQNRLVYLHRDREPEVHGWGLRASARRRPIGLRLGPHVTNRASFVGLSPLVSCS